MKSSSCAVLLLGIALVCNAGLSGCGQSATSPAVSAPRPSDPESVFEEIVARVKWDIQGGLDKPRVRSFVYPTAVVFIEEGVVDSQLYPPDEEHSDYRASITIASSVKYSARQVKEEIDKPQAKAATPGLLEDFAADGDASGFGTGFDSDSAFVEAATKQEEPTTKVREIVGRHEDQDQQVYEFVYQDSRWELKTEIDETTNSGMLRTFEYALAIQQPSNQAESSAGAESSP